MRSVGFDIATCTGAFVLENGAGQGKTIELPNLRGFLRLHLIAQEVDRTLHIWEPEVAVVEGYAFSRNVSSFQTLVEVGTVLRKVLYDRRIPWYEVPPTVLKKWTTGKGHAKKPEMALAVKTRWGFASPSHDIVDAYALAQMGQLGPDLLTITGVKLGWDTGK